jgi:hypothetical protein
LSAIASQLAVPGWGVEQSALGWTAAACVVAATAGPAARPAVATTVHAVATRTAAGASTRVFVSASRAREIPGMKLTGLFIGQGVRPLKSA